MKSRRSIKLFKSNHFELYNLQVLFSAFEDIKNTQEMCTRLKMILLSQLNILIHIKNVSHLMVINYI